MVIKFIKKKEGINLIRSKILAFINQENAREMGIKYIKKEEVINPILSNTSFHLPGECTWDGDQVYQEEGRD